MAYEAPREAPSAQHPKFFSFQHPPHHTPDRANTFSPHPGALCALCLERFLQALPVAACLPRPPKLSLDVSSSARSLSAQSTAPPLLTLPVASSGCKLQLFHLPVCSLVYCLSPSTTGQIAGKACLSVHHWIPSI